MLQMSLGGGEHPQSSGSWLSKVGEAHKGSSPERCVPFLGKPIPKFFYHDEKYYSAWDGDLDKNQIPKISNAYH